MPRGRSVSLNYILYKYVDTISNDILIVDILIDKVNHDKSDKYLRNIASAKFMGCQNCGRTDIFIFDLANHFAKPKIIVMLKGYFQKKNHAFTKAKHTFLWERAKCIDPIVTTWRGSNSKA